MKFSKRIVAALTAVFLLLSFAACSGNNTDTTTAAGVTESTVPQVDVVIPSPDYEVKIRIASTNDYMGLITSKIATDKGYACDIEASCESYADVSQKLLNGTADIGVLPLGDAVKLYEDSDGAVKIISACAGISYQIITSDTSIDSVSDLRGKTVYSAVGGTYAESVVRFIFEENGVSFDDVIVSDSLSYSEIAQKATAGEIEICLLPEPYASSVCTSNENYKRAVSLDDAYTAETGNDSLLGCFVARTEFIESHPELVTEFLEFSEIFTNYYTLFTDGAALDLYASRYFSTAILAGETLLNSELKFAKGEALVTLVEANLGTAFETDVAATDLCYTVQ